MEHQHHLANLQIILFYFKTILAFGFQNGAQKVLRMSNRKKTISTLVVRLMLCLLEVNIVHFLFAYFFDVRIQQVTRVVDINKQ
jgi:hypothetical protein